MNNLCGKHFRITGSAVSYFESIKRFQYYPSFTVFTSNLNNTKEKYYNSTDSWIDILTKYNRMKRWKINCCKSTYYFNI